MPSSVPHIFIDTNVILDIVLNRRNESLGLLEKARQGEWIVSASLFAVAEALDVLQEHRWFLRELNERRREVSSVLRERGNRTLPEDALDEIDRDVNEFLKRRYPFIEYYPLSGTGFNDANGICAKSNIRATDSLHIATAIEVSADLFVTSDGVVLRDGGSFIEVSNPANAIEKLGTMGFQII